MHARSGVPKIFAVFNLLNCMQILASFDTRRPGSETERDLPGHGKAAQRLRKSHARGQYSLNGAAES